jgi:hypothetical protein
MRLASDSVDECLVNWRARCARSDCVRTGCRRRRAVQRKYFDRNVSRARRVASIRRIRLHGGRLHGVRLYDVRLHGVRSHGGRRMQNGGRRQTLCREQQAHLQALARDRANSLCSSSSRSNAELYEVTDPLGPSVVVHTSTSSLNAASRKLSNPRSTGLSRFAISMPYAVLLPCSDFYRSHLRSAIDHFSICKNEHAYLEAAACRRVTTA